MLCDKKQLTGRCLLCDGRHMEAFTKYLAGHSISRRAFANKIGVHHSVVARWASGDARPGMDMAFKIERMTGGEVPVASWTREEPA